MNIKPANTCDYDIVSLGEVMLRLDPGEGRVRTARSFQAWEGGGEYNVARGLRKCFGLRTGSNFSHQTCCCDIIPGLLTVRCCPQVISHANP